MLRGEEKLTLQQTTSKAAHFESPCLPRADIKPESDLKTDYPVLRCGHSVWGTLKHVSLHLCKQIPGSESA